MPIFQKKQKQVYAQKEKKSHFELDDIGLNTHVQIDAALLKLLAGFTAQPLPPIPVSEDLTAQVDGSINHFSLSHKSRYQVQVSCNLRQSPDAIIMDADMRGFYLSFVPTTRDILIVEYFR